MYIGYNKNNTSYTINKQNIIYVDILKIKHKKNKILIKKKVTLGLNFIRNSLKT